MRKGDEVLDISKQRAPCHGCVLVECREARRVARQQCRLAGFCKPAFVSLSPALLAVFRTPASLQRLA